MSALVDVKAARKTANKLLAALSRDHQRTEKDNAIKLENRERDWRFCFAKHTVTSKELQRIRRAACSGIKKDAKRRKSSKLLLQITEGSRLATSSIDSMARNLLMSNTVQQPLTFYQNGVDLAAENELLKYSAHIGWKFQPLRRLWTFGYQASTISSIFDALPSHFLHQIESALAAFEAIPKSRGFINTNLNTVDHDENCNDNIVENNSTCKAWELVMNFDPDTQVRRGCCSSICVAQLLGMHREELLARLAQHDLPLPFIETDGLRLFMHSLCQIFAAPSPGRKLDRYVRIRGAGGRGVLICWQTRFSFGLGGGVQQV
jgi:hypothetical protein